MIHVLFFYFKKGENMTIKEKQEICSKALMMWFFQEKENHDFSNHDKEVLEIFTTKVLLKKFDVFDIDIVLPDPLLMILDICVSGNPGQIQIVLKDLLNSIKKRTGPIKPGYVISSMDFSLCFPFDFPIIELPKMTAKYESLWIGQKIETDSPFSTDNLCDTPEWWKEVME